MPLYYNQYQGCFVVSHDDLFFIPRAFSLGANSKKSNLDIKSHKSDTTTTIVLFIENRIVDRPTIVLLLDDDIIFFVTYIKLYSSHNPTLTWTHKLYLSHRSYTHKQSKDREGQKIKLM